MVLHLPLTLLALAGAPLAPPLVQGVARNGAALVVVPSAAPASSGLVTAAVDITLPDGMGDDGGAATLPTLAAAAAAVVGKDARVEASWRPGHLGLVVIAPSTTPDVATRAIDAVLKAVRAPAAKDPKTPPPPPLMRGRPLPAAANDVAAARSALAKVGAGHVAVVVIAPGPGPELLRRTQALLTAPLGKSTPPTPTIAPTDDDHADHVLVAGGNTPATRAALEVVAEVIGGHVHDAGPDVRVGMDGPPDVRRTQLMALVEEPPPQQLVDEVIRARRLALAAPLRDAAALAEALAADLADGQIDTTFSGIDALDAVDRAAVADAARLVLGVKP